MGTFCPAERQPKAVPEGRSRISRRLCPYQCRSKACWPEAWIPSSSVLTHVCCVHEYCPRHHMCCQISLPSPLLGGRGGQDLAIHSRLTLNLSSCCFHSPSGTRHYTQPLSVCGCAFVVGATSAELYSRDVLEEVR